MRPDFAMRSLATDLSEPPINILESAIRNRLLDYYRELDALKYALAKGEIEARGVDQMEWVDRILEGARNSHRYPRPQYGCRCDCHRHTPENHRAIYAANHRRFASTRELI